MLDEVCEVLPVDQDECDATINQMFETAIAVFESYKPLEVYIQTLQFQRIVKEGVGYCWDFCGI